LSQRSYPLICLFFAKSRVRSCIIVVIVVNFPSVSWSWAYDGAKTADVANAIEHNAVGFAGSSSARSTCQPLRVFRSSTFFVIIVITAPATISADLVIACVIIVVTIGCCVPRRHGCAGAKTTAHLLNVQAAALSRAQKKHALNTRFVEAFGQDTNAAHLNDYNTILMSREIAHEMVHAIF
jgi:hypothetical protein